MPSTSYTDATMGARTIGARTDNVGAPVTDLSAEEDRYPTIVMGEGYLLPANSFLPVAGSAATMNVVIGSGAAKADYYVVAGDVAGQGNYIIRLAAATETVTLDAADGSLDRIDEIYLVVQDNAYDSSGNALPRFGYRKGDAAASPSNPGADANWDAEVLIARIDVPAGAADITQCTVTDMRAPSTMSVAGLTTSGGGISMGGGNITGVGTVDGVDVSAHTHGGAGQGGSVDATNLINLKAAVDGALVDADTVDGQHASAFAPIAHVGAGGVSVHPAATGATAGFMSSGDKSKLDAIESGATADQVLTQGSGISITGSGDYTIAHADTSAQGSINNSGAAFIQDVTLDGFGHVTALGSATITPGTIGAAASAHSHNGAYYTYEGASPAIWISTAGPSGGNDGDIWFKW